MINKRNLLVGLLFAVIPAGTVLWRLLIIYIEFETGEYVPIWARIVLDVAVLVTVIVSSSFLQRFRSSRAVIIVSGLAAACLSASGAAISSSSGGSIGGGLLGLMGLFISTLVGILLIILFSIELSSASRQQKKLSV